MTLNVADWEKIIKELKAELTFLKVRVNDITQDTDRLERHYWRDCLLIHDIPWKTKGNPRPVIIKFVRQNNRKKVFSS